MGAVGTGARALGVWVPSVVEINAPLHTPPSSLAVIPAERWPPCVAWRSAGGTLTVTAVVGNVEPPAAGNAARCGHSGNQSGSAELL